MFITQKMIDVIRKEQKKITSYYTRKTNRPYTSKKNLTEKQKHLKTLLATSKKRALERGLVWELELDDIIIPETCPYLGMSLTFIRGEGRIQSNISIDRKDSTKGYTKDNVEFISDLANRMKQEATQEQLVSFAHGVLFRLKK